MRNWHLAQLLSDENSNHDNLLLLSLLLSLLLLLLYTTYCPLVPLPLLFLFVQGETSAIQAPYTGAMRFAKSGHRQQISSR